MSYYCKIAFKQLPAEDVYDFLCQYKREVASHIYEIAQQNRVFSPVFRAHDGTKQFKPSREVVEATKNWARLSVFHYRYFYDKEHQLLGMYGVHDALYSLFDAVCEFQNSCDQDYDFDVWNGIACFESVAQKWKNASVDALKVGLGEYWDHVKWEEKRTEELDYYRRTAAYQEIWDWISHTLDDDDGVVYLSLYGYYDAVTVQTFVAAIVDAANEWYAPYI